MRARYGMFIALLMFTAFATAGESLRVSWGAHNAPPYAIAEAGELRSGIIHDIGVEVARRTDSAALFLNVPRARYEEQLRNGQVDLTCITSPDWLEHPESFDWSPALFDETDIVVQATGTRPWTSIDDLVNRQVATIQAYRYAALEPLFAAGRVRRSDGANLDSNMQRLALGRVDAVVDASIPVHYWMRQNDSVGRFPIAAFELSRHAVQCAISRQVPGGNGRIRDAFERMARDGSLRAIVNRYLPAH